MPHGALATGSPGSVWDTSTADGDESILRSYGRAPRLQREALQRFRADGKALFQDRDACSRFALGFERQDIVWVTPTGVGPQREQGQREEILDNSSFGCRLAAHSVGSQMIWVFGSQDTGIPNPCSIVQLPRGGEWLRNHVSIPKGSVVW